MPQPMICVFCDIAADADNRLRDRLPEEAADTDVLRAWPDAYVMVPINPVVEGGHLLVIPREHVDHAAESPAVTAATMARAAALVAELDWDANIITSKGSAATQTIPHLHVHIVRRVEGDGISLPWDPRS